jgi:hypothetical protein
MPPPEAAMRSIAYLILVKAWLADQIDCKAPENIALSNMRSTLYKIVASAPVMPSKKLCASIFMSF